MVYRIDSSAYLTSSVESASNGPTFVDGNGMTQGDKTFVSNFLSLSDAIHNKTEDAYEKIAKSIRDINAQLHYNSKSSGSGNTLLHEAVKEVNFKAAEVLVANGASPDIPNESGKTPRMLAEGNAKLTEIFKRVVQKTERYQVISSESRDIHFELGRFISRHNVCGIDLEVYTYRRNFNFGTEAGDNATVSFSATNNQGSAITLKVTVKKIKDTTNGQMGYQIVPENDKEIGVSLLVMTPNISKYLIGKDYTFIEKAQQKEEGGGNCVIS